MRAKKTRVGSVDEKRERERGRENCGGLSRDLNGSESEIQQRRRVENKGQRNVNTITLAIGSTGLWLGAGMGRRVEQTQEDRIHYEKPPSIPIPLGFCPAARPSFVFIFFPFRPTEAVVTATTPLLLCGLPPGGRETTHRRKKIKYERTQKKQEKNEQKNSNKHTNERAVEIRGKVERFFAPTETALEGGGGKREQK